MPYLTETMESIIAQDLQNIEIIAVNDGSTDGSGEELDRFAALDARISVYHQPNSGWPGMPRNRGLNLARGTFVMFMDADDTLAPHALRTLVEQSEEKGADVAIPRFEGTGGRGIQTLFLLYPEGDISYERAMETISPQKLFRREMIEKHGLRFPEGEVRLEDGIFVTQTYVLARRIIFCGKDPLYFIALRGDGQNISTRPIDPFNYVDSCRKIAETLLAGVPDRARAEKLVMQFFTRKGLRFYAPKRWQKFDAERKSNWVKLHREFLRDLVPQELDASVQNPTDRRKIELIRAGSVAQIDTLIGAELSLTHTSRYVGGRATPDTIELRIAVLPDPTATLLLESLPAERKVWLSRAINRLARPLFRLRAVRGASRRTANLMLGEAPGATLMLAGRKARRTTGIPGRLVGMTPGANGAASTELIFSFVLPRPLLQRFAGDRVDAWTVAQTVSGMSGPQRRVAAAPKPKSLGGLVYRTNQGNLSLNLLKL
ncbi:glycosyltransferase family 2 protein [Leucobacter insecticola]|uniref:Glycosyltransferase family 2 protein n=2 Tax=Leucobacter insecticola TaxID=2714934 RepID=A0A6G8FM35_9MICO|nr:glycosyltransferase family 2 protein [Leucobacter insecticola]